MQNKNKIYLFAAALFFLSVFFVRIDNVTKIAKADAASIAACQSQTDALLACDPHVDDCTAVINASNECQAAYKANLAAAYCDSTCLTCDNGKCTECGENEVAIGSGCGCANGFDENNNGDCVASAGSTTACQSAGGSCDQMVGVTCETKSELGSGMVNEVTSSLSCNGVGTCCMPAGGSATTGAQCGYMLVDGKCFETKEAYCASVPVNSDTNRCGTTTAVVKTDAECKAENGPSFSATADGACVNTGDASSKCSDPSSPYECDTTCCTCAEYCSYNGLTADQCTCDNSSGAISGTGASTIEATKTTSGVTIPSGSSVVADANGSDVAITPSGQSIALSAADISSMISTGILQGSILPATGGAGAGASSLPGGSYSSGGSWALSNHYGLPQGSISGIVSSLLSWLLELFAILGIIGFVLSGIFYLLAGADEGNAEKGKNGMKWSIIGIIVGLSGYVIMQAAAMFLAGSSINF